MFDELWPETEGRRIEKFRRKMNLDHGLVAELDSYEGSLEGLVVVEVEFESEAGSAGFWPPAWFGRELTGDPAWANQSLAVDGLPERSLEYRLRPGEEPGSAVCRVIAARASQAAGAVRAAGHSSDQATQVHEARKSLKKARSALRLLRGVIDDDERKAANGSGREAARRLSGARDAEVKLTTLDLVADTDPPDSGIGRGAWRKELENEAAAHRGDLTTESLADIARQIESVARSFRGRRLPNADGKISGNLVRTYRRGRRSMKKARRRGGEAEQFHSWRKRAKDLRYQLEILEPRLPEGFIERRKAAEELGDKLGDLHDLDVLAEDLAGRGLDREQDSRLAEAISNARAKQIKICFALGRDVYGPKPGRFRNQIVDGLAASD